MFYETLIEGGKHWSLSVRAGTQLRIIDQQGRRECRHAVL